MNFIKKIYFWTWFQLNCIICSVVGERRVWVGHRCVVRRLAPPPPLGPALRYILTSNATAYWHVHITSNNRQIRDGTNIKNIIHFTVKYFYLNVGASLFFLHSLSFTKHCIQSLRNNLYSTMFQTYMAVIS